MWTCKQCETTNEMYLCTVCYEPKPEQESAEQIMEQNKKARNKKRLKVFLPFLVSLLMFAIGLIGLHTLSANRFHFEEHTVIEEFDSMTGGDGFFQTSLG